MFCLSQLLLMVLSICLPPCEQNLTLGCITTHSLTFLWLTGVCVGGGGWGFGGEYYAVWSPLSSAWAWAAILLILNCHNQGLNTLAT